MELKSAEQSPKAKQMERIVYTAISNEATALGYTPNKVKEIQANYENYISSITNTVRGQVSSLKNEEEVFSHLASVFYSNFEYAKRKLIVTGFESKPPTANCYVSSMMFADVMARLGIDVQVGIVPNHVFLVGKEYRFETTLDKSKILRYTKDIDKVYPINTIGDKGFLLSASHSSIGLYLLSKDKDVEAVESFKKAVEIAPRNADAQYNLGLTYLKTEQYENAISAYKRALSLNKSNGDIDYGLGVAYYGNDEYDLAISCFKESLKKKRATTPDKTVYDSMAKVYEVMDKTDLAKKYHKQARAVKN